MTTSVLTEKLKEAIQAQHEQEVARLLARGQSGGIYKGNPEPVELALDTHNLTILRAVANAWSGDGLARSYARALEEGWKAEADLLLTIGEAKTWDTRLSPRDVLREAAKHGWLRALDHVLHRNPDVLSDKSPSDWKGSPLVVAIKADQREALDRLLQAEVGALLVFDATLSAAKEGRPRLLPLLWDRNALDQQGATLAQMVIEGQTAALNWALSTFSDDELKQQWTQDLDTLNQTLCQGAAQGQARLVRMLLTLPKADPKADKSAALRAAVEQGHDELIALLLPLSDPKAARQAWLKQSPPQWPMVDQLGLHLPAADQAIWCNRPEQMPQLVAARRAAQMQEAAPSAPAVRRRLRS